MARAVLQAGVAHATIGAVLRGFCVVGLLLASTFTGCVPNERPAGKGEGTSVAPASAQRPNKKPRSDKKARLDARKRPDAAARRTSTASSTDDPQSASGAASVSSAAPSQSAPSAPQGSPYSHDFERAELGPDWNLTSPAWRLDKGRLCVQGARNHPAWLKRRLPANARIEFDAVSSSPDGDIKIEVWGDGKSAAVSTSYTNASSYIVIFGGWKNTYHVLARIDEHAKGRPEVRIDAQSGDLRAQPVQPDRSYHFKIERSDGKTVRWYVDDIEIIGFSDPAPLAGEGHEHLGFNNWETRVCFDNLQVVPL